MVKFRIKPYIAQPLVVALVISVIAHMFTLSAIQKWLFGEEGRAESGAYNESLFVEMQKSQPKPRAEVPAAEFPKAEPDKTAVNEQKDTPSKELVQEDDAAPPANEVARSLKKAADKTSTEQAASLNAPDKAGDSKPAIQSEESEEKTKEERAQGAANDKEQVTNTEPVFAQNIDYLYTPMPEYPPIAKRLRQEGTVLLKVHVNAGGEPVNLMLHESSGHKLLDRAALKAVEAWRFSPHLQGNQPVEAWVIIPVEFKLQR